jgi:hypothetical protein
MIQSSKWIFEQFCSIFPHFGSEENIDFYPNGRNSIRLEFKNPNYPIMIFTYNNKRDWELVTLDYYITMDNAVKELREKLSNAQILNREIRRKEKRDNVKN